MGDVDTAQGLTSEDRTDIQTDIGEKRVGRGEVGAVNQRRVHPPTSLGRRIAPRAARATGSDPVTQPTIVEQTTVDLPPLQRMTLHSAPGQTVHLAVAPRRTLVTAPFPSAPLEQSVVDRSELATGRGLTYEWEFFLASVLDRLGVLEVGGSGSGGTGGTGGLMAYRHVQTVPGTVWNVTHSLGYDPAGLLVISADGFVLDGVGVQYLVTGQTLRLSTDIAVAGVAYFS